MRVNHCAPKPLSDPEEGRSLGWDPFHQPRRGESPGAAVASLWRNPEEKPLRRVKLDPSALQEDARKLGVGLMLAGLVGWLLQDGSLNAIYAGTVGTLLIFIGSIRIVEG